ncbi:hypothetical protein KXX58_006910, partial [Aspergillus fumigatus]
MIVRANVPGSGSGWRGAHSVWGGPCVGPRAHTKWASQVRPLLGPQGDLVTRAVSRAQGRSALEACARLPTGPLRARGPSLAAAGRARPAYIGRGVCVSMAPVGHADLPPLGGCLRIPTDGCRRRAVPASVEADGHVRVAASVPVAGARLSGADKGARAPANWSPLAPPVSVWVSLDPVCLRVCRSASVCPWRAPLPAGGRPAQGAPANWSPCRPPARRPPPRQLGQPTGRRALACAPPPPPPPPRPPRPPFVALARATLCSPRGRAPTGPPSTDSPQPGPSRAPPAAPHRPRPAHHRARKRSRVRTSFRGEAHLRRQTARRPCGHVPPPTGHCPS